MVSWTEVTFPSVFSKGDESVSMIFEDLTQLF